MRKKIGLNIICVFLILILCCKATYAMSCSVTKVLDGDTIHCIPTKEIMFAKTREDGSVIVRLKGVDAPEKKQPFGLDAKNALEDKILYKTVKLDIRGLDKYGRITAYVWFENTNINLEQIKQGWAWAYTEYLDRPYAGEFYAAEKRARKQRLGLWQQSNPAPPWEYRKKKH